jgi:hypothetical protein
MKTQAKTINEFFTAAGARESDLRRLDVLIQEIAPELERTLFDGMSITGMYHYKYASGREADWPLIGLANQKHYISLYICAMKDDTYLAEHYGDRLGKVNNGKSCIRFKKVDDLNLGEIKNIVRDAAAWHKENNT